MSQDLIDSIELDNHYVIHLYPDPEAENPRDFDNLGSMACAHSRYNLGDEQEWKVGETGDIDYDLERAREQVGGEIIALPLYLLDHSGLRISTGDFSDPFDSGQVGFIYISVERALSELGDGSEELSEEIRQKALDVLRAEVDIYDSFISGGAVRYELLDPNGEVIDSCSGFYSLEDAEESARLSVPQDTEE